MPVNRKKRRADGTLRPSIVRRRKRKRSERNAIKRAEWLAQFAPGERERFFNHVILADAIFLNAFQKMTLATDRADAAQLLERIANERHWRKLRTLDGTVVGIAPSRRSRVPFEHNGPAPDEVSETGRSQSVSEHGGDSDAAPTIRTMPVSLTPDPVLTDADGADRNHADGDERIPPIAL